MMKKILNNCEEKLHMEFSKLALDYKRMRNKLLMLLPEIAKAGIPEKLGFENIYDYALKIGGLPFSTVGRVIRLKKKLENLPKLYGAIEKVGISKIEIVARVANEKTEDFWMDKALNMSRTGVEISVKEEIFHGGEKHGGEKHDDVKYGGESRLCFAAPEKVKVSLSMKAQKSFNRLKKQMKIEKGIKVDEKAMEIMLRKLEELMAVEKNVKKSGEKLEELMACGTVKRNEVQSKKVHTGVKIDAGGESKKVTRYVSAQEKREVEDRSEKICEYAGCTKALEEFHHKERFAGKKSHKSLTALCKAHHEMAHNGFIINELDEIGGWKMVSKMGDLKPLGFIDQKLREIRGSVMQV